MAAPSDQWVKLKIFGFIFIVSLFSPTKQKFYCLSLKYIQNLTASLNTFTTPTLAGAVTSCLKQCNSLLTSAILLLLCSSYSQFSTGSPSDSFKMQVGTCINPAMVPNCTQKTNKQQKHTNVLPLGGK